MAPSSDVPDDAVTCVCPTSSARGRFWPRLLDSFRRQTYAHKWLIVVSDGEPSPELAEEPAVEFLPAADDADLGARRNLACRAARGRWIAHFEDDDVYAPDYLESMLSELTASRAPCGKLGDWLVCDLQRACWAEFLGRRPLEGRFAVQGAMRIMSHGFSLVYERPLAERFPFRERAAATAAAAGPSAEQEEECEGEGAGGGEECEEEEGSEDSEDEETKVARALGRGSMDDMALLRKRLKEQEKKGAQQQLRRDSPQLPFVEACEDRDFLLRLLAAGVPVQLVHGRPGLCVHVQHGASAWGTVAHRWIPDPASALAGSRLGEVVPAEWLEFGAPQPLPPPTADARRFALASWGVAGRPGHPTMLPGEISEEGAQLAAHTCHLAAELRRQTREASARVLELHLRVAEGQKELGNGHFRVGELDGAAACYGLALRAADVVTAFAHEVAGPLRSKGDAVRYAALCNLAHVAMRRGAAEEAEAHASAAIPLDREGFKAWWRRAQAREALGRPGDAAQDLLAAWRRAPEPSRERTEIGRSLARARARGDLAAVGAGAAAVAGPGAAPAEAGGATGAPPLPPPSPPNAAAAT